eukprot:scaffold17437_cov173-Amphora_coffeaeformis.AAC.7
MQGPLGPISRGGIRLGRQNVAGNARRQETVEPTVGILEGRFVPRRPSTGHQDLGDVRRGRVVQTTLQKTHQEFAGRGWYSRIAAIQTRQAEQIARILIVGIHSYGSVNSGDCSTSWSINTFHLHRSIHSHGSLDGHDRSGRPLVFEIAAFQGDTSTVVFQKHFIRRPTLGPLDEWFIRRIGHGFLD